MAKKAKSEAKKLERAYNIPLRKQVMKSPKYKRSKKAVDTVKVFIAKHMKVDLENVKIGQHLNMEIWQNGIRNPPHHVKVNVIKEKDGDVFVAKAELEGKEFKALKIQEKKVTSSGLKGKLEEMKGKITTKDNLEDLAEGEKETKDATKPTDDKSANNNDDVDKQQKKDVELKK